MGKGKNQEVTQKYSPLPGTEPGGYCELSLTPLIINENI